MAITIIEILASDNLGASRTTINQNFESCRVAIDQLESFIDAGSNAISLNDGAISPTETIKITGNDGKIVASELSITSNNGIVNTGILTVGGVTQLNNTLNVTNTATFQDSAIISKNLETSGHIVHDSVTNIDVQGENVFAGQGVYNPSDKYYLSLNFANSTNIGVEDIFILGSGAKVGQKLIITLEALANNTSSGFIDISGSYTNPVIQVGGSIGTNIELSALYSNVELYWNGIYWILTGGNGYTIS